MTHPTCTRCPAPARWRDGDEPVCHLHATDAALRGRRIVLLPPADVVDRLEAISGLQGDTAGVELCMHAAAEIRRLRAALDKSVTC